MRITHISVPIIGAGNACATEAHAPAQGLVEAGVNAQAGRQEAW